MFRTELKLSPAEWSLSYRDNAMALGSCFAENIGGYLERLKYPIAVNPFGSVYNPLSIRNSMALLLNGYDFTEDDLFTHEDLWHSFQHHSSFSGPDPATVLKDIREEMDRARLLLPRLRCLMLTFGTAWVYELKDNGQVVSNCHKLPETLFLRRRLSLNEIVDAMSGLLGYLHENNPELRVVLSVSPIRHLKDTLPGNQLSKSTLLVACHELAESHPFVEYFPAYELLVDDLRDYRFYADDMVHPSNTAVAYVWQKFEERYLTEKEKSLRQRVDKLQRGLEHRPFNPESKPYQYHVERLLNTMSDLEREYPFLDFTEEREALA